MLFGPEGMGHGHLLVGFGGGGGHAASFVY
jgi:hypothetical protein